MAMYKETRDLEVTDVYFKVRNKKYPFLNSDGGGPAQVTLQSYRQQDTLDNPHWMWYINNGFSATTGMHGELQKAYAIRGYIEVDVESNPTLPESSPDRSVTTYTVEGPGIVAASLPNDLGSASLVNAESRAMEGFLLACRKAISSFEGGVFIAELAQAIHGIRHPAEALKDYLTWHALEAKRLRRRMRDRGEHNKRISRAISQLWLEKAYHWGPLVGDMESSAESLARAGERDDHQVVSFEGFDKFSSDSAFAQRSWPGVQVNYGLRYIEDAKVRFYGMVRAGNPPGSSNQFLERGFGISLSQALPTLWELIPFSFVADYFSNIGGLISAYSFPTAQIRWMNRAILRELVTQTISAKVNQIPSTSLTRYEYKSVNPGSFRGVRRIWQRSAYDPSDLIPGFRLEVPGIGDWPKWLNLSALAHVIAT